MTEEEFMELRESCHKAIAEKHDMILTAWCKEAGVKTPVGYHLDVFDGTYYQNCRKAPRFSHGDIRQE